MINVVLYQPEIPGNTGNIMRTCAATETRLHLIKPLGFSLDESYIKRSGANYIKDCDYTVYESWDDFKSKNKGIYYYLTRYGKKPHTSFDYGNRNENIYFVFGKESSVIPLNKKKNDLEHCLRIPMTNKVRALNLSNCAAILVYEALRQQDYNDLLITEPFKGEDYIKTGIDISES